MWLINMEAVSGEIYLGEANTDSTGTLDEPVTVTIVCSLIASRLYCLLLLFFLVRKEI